MPRTTDVFGSLTSKTLINIVSAAFHRSGVTRMSRAEIVNFLATAMVQDEIAMLEALARVPLENITSCASYFPRVHRKMQEKYGRAFPVYLNSPLRVADARLRVALDLTAEEMNANTECWPPTLSQSAKDTCIRNFIDNTNLRRMTDCAVCARRLFNLDLLFTDKHLKYQVVAVGDLDLSVLKIIDPHLLARPGRHFQYGHPALDGLALHRGGIHSSAKGTTLSICDDCHGPLSRTPPTLPRLSLANDNIRGFLPDHLLDCTWLEERLAAKYLASAYIIRLYDVVAPMAEEMRSRAMKGHTCAFPLNTISTASKLPWTFEDGGALLSCIIIGPRKPTAADLRGVFKVRKKKVLDLICFLAENFKDYPVLSIDKEAINRLPEDDVPELLMRNVVYQESSEVPSLFASETAGLDPHPALLGDADLDDEVGKTFLEHHGTVDLNGISIPAHHRVASALSNATGTERPDLVIRHGASIVREDRNPGLFPGLFPTLFPWGTGGFELKRRTPFAFDNQARYLLDLSDPGFRRHWSFLFVVANIKQRRAVLHGTRLACQRRDHDRFAEILGKLHPGTVKRVADRIAAGGNISNLTGEEAQIYSVLKRCELVSRMVPGSRAVMTRARADIRAYIGRFGIFHLFVTLNPAATHAPLFQVFFGDPAIDLKVDAPSLPSATVRGRRVADDPVAASDYFHFHVASVFQHLLGWDLRNKCSTPQGGIFGRLSAFFLVKEHNMRGQLHCHCLLWLEGAPNPSELRAKMRANPTYRDQVLAFFDDIIWNGYPSGRDPDSSGGTNEQDTRNHLHSTTASSPSNRPDRQPKAERPPDPRKPHYRERCEEDHFLLVHGAQRHRCTFSCFKGGRASCRFLFPRELVPSSFFDPDTNSLWLRVLHPYINEHNKSLLLAARHNIDVNAVHSGRAGLAAASYITGYATKCDETPANQVSMISTVYERLLAAGSMDINTAKLLTLCVMQFGRQRQLHAQQAATYVRDLGDTSCSHETIPMLSGQLICTVVAMFGPVRSEFDTESSPLADVDEETENLRSFPTASPSGPTSATEATAADGTALDDDEADAYEVEELTGLLFDDPESALLPLSTAGVAHQVDDYVYRGSTLERVSFYDFVRHVTLVLTPNRPNKNHHKLNPRHPNALTHMHRYHPNKETGIPRPICASFPRSDGSVGHGDAYCCAMLAHFIPFRHTRPLKPKTVTWESAFLRAQFPPEALLMMSNWAALSECDDARDAEELLRRRREATRARRTEVDLEDSGGVVDSANADVIMEDLLRNRPDESEETSRFSNVLEPSAWLERRGPVVPTTDLTAPVFPTYTMQQRRQWTEQQRQLEAQALADRALPVAAAGILAEQLSFGSQAAPLTSLGAELPLSLPALPTQHLRWRDRPPHELLDALVQERGLTESQALAFKVAGRRFFEDMNGVCSSPLRLLMHGEAGTGKTVVVRLLRELMDRYGRGKEIMFLAPTGKAASAIGGQTQHSAFSISVANRGQTTEELSTASGENTGQRLRSLAATFSSVRWLFFDEVSMTSCELLCEMDQAMRAATQKLNDPFGGINVIFAGDLCQLPPVRSAPLYSPGSNPVQPSETRTKVELGRTSWLLVDEVVEFREQMRMKDACMAKALSRLRIRKCTDEDVDLFNSNVLSSAPAIPALKERGDVIVLARTNQTVRTLNHRKAAVQARVEDRGLVVSHAQDKTDSPLSAEARTALLAYNGHGDNKVGLGRLPLYVGMPVVYRGANVSVALGITNGAFGTVKAWNLSVDRFGLTVPGFVIVQFAPDATWRLDGLDPGCVPIFSRKSTFSFRLPNTDATLSVRRQQLPLQPGFAMTVHAAQGITSTAGVVVDLRRGGFHAYVAASRATRRQDVFLISPVTLANLNTPALPAQLRTELDRLDALALTTKRRHEHSRWRLPVAAATSSELSCSCRSSACNAGHDEPSHFPDHEDRHSTHSQEERMLDHTPTTSGVRGPSPTSADRLAKRPRLASNEPDPELL